MKRHTYSLLTTLIRLGKAMLSAAESWVRMEFEETNKDKQSATAVLEEER